MGDLPPRRRRPGAPKSGGQKRRRPPESRSRSDRPRSKSRGGKGGKTRSHKKSSNSSPTGAIIGGVVGVAVIGVVVALVMFGPSVGSLAAFTDSYESVMNDAARLTFTDMPDYMEATLKEETPPISAESLGKKMEKLALRRLRIGPVSKDEKEAMEKKMEEKWKEQKDAFQERQKRIQEEMKAKAGGQNDFAAMREGMKAFGDAMKALGAGAMLMGAADRALVVPEEGNDDHDRIQVKAITIIQELAPTLADVDSVSSANSRLDRMKKALAEMEALQKEAEALGEDPKGFNQSSSNKYRTLGFANASLLRALKGRIEEKAPGNSEVESTLSKLSLAYSAARRGRGPIGAPGMARTSPTSSNTAGTSGEALNVTPNDQRVKNNMKQIMLAMHNYHSAKKQMPRAGDGPNADEGLSWRVHLLPYLEQKPLYDQFHLDEPWDSPHNKTLIGKMPQIFKGVGTGGTGKSTIHVFAGDGQFFSLEKPSFRNCTDGTTNTLAIVDTSFRKADVWTKPGGLTLSSGSAQDLLGEVPKEFYVAATLDGRAFFLKKDAPADFMTALIRHNDNQILNERQKYIK